jgi:hypothetical protein
MNRRVFKKKPQIVCNGTNTVIIKTLHGSIQFKNQRFKDREGHEVSGYVESVCEGLHHHCQGVWKNLPADMPVIRAIAKLWRLSRMWWWEQLSSQTIHKLVADRPTSGEECSIEAVYNFQRRRCQR